MVKDSSPPGENLEEPASGVKRRRIALACKPCRIRKSRCDGARPKCDLCVRMAFECTYDKPGSATNLVIRKDAFDDIEARLRFLEEELKWQGEQLASSDNRSLASSAPSAAWPGPVASDKAAPTVPNAWDFGAVEVHSRGRADQVPDTTHTDGMAISFVDEQDQGFFGPSANISFMRIIMRAVAGHSCASRIADSLNNESPGVHGGSMMSINTLQPRVPPAAAQSTMPEPLQGPVNPDVLPSYDDIERLIEGYFDNTGTLFPYIHRPSFMETYHRAKQSGFTDVRRTWLGLLNIILAMATRADASRQDTKRVFTESDIFYRRGEELCRTQMFRGTTLEIVQYLLLGSQYLQGTQRAIQTWTTHGLAVKAALSIGLHSNAASRKFPPVEQEMRKRTWYGCVILDRSLSMTFGRPSAIPEYYIRIELPKPINNEEQDVAPVQFFSQTIKLYKILWNIMADLYGNNVEHESLTETELITRIMRLEQDMKHWQDSLPESLRLRTTAALPSQPPADLNGERFRIVLTLRHLNTQLLLLRPILTNLLQIRLVGDSAQPAAWYSTSHMQKTFTVSCFKAAVELINIIHAVSTKKELGRHLLGAWWFTLYYVLNASLAVFGILLLPADDVIGLYAASISEQDEGQRALDKATEALLELGHDNPLVDRCVDHLRQLCRVLQDKTQARIGAVQDGDFRGSEMTPVNGPAYTEENLFGVPFLDHHAMFEDEVGIGFLLNDENQLRLNGPYSF
ncbi:hypothetical protein NLU13_7982 [Sarocladium strictum]|uniref:Zn(2)-C6 fungal-type domain-containing protein n=1 Tax=Sarocladium strictum TaxID=5046 RepID=A0AA39GAS9_SARSR|nr:hypothetical protein NLU13_7982 [Sarocladium strictum]